MLELYCLSGVSFEFILQNGFGSGVKTVQKSGGGCFNGAVLFTRGHLYTEKLGTYLTQKKQKTIFVAELYTLEP